MDHSSSDDSAGSSTIGPFPLGSCSESLLMLSSGHLHSCTILSSIFVNHRTSRSWLLLLSCAHIESNPPQTLESALKSENPNSQRLLEEVVRSLRSSRSICKNPLCRLFDTEWILRLSMLWL
ncbi:hypothetical protein LWI29_025690 [Acer saccharum]|uniref:Uncharacterized protein n=1 Tax=Acer saccharum TaxID=4024 RepID=A0AA39RIZ0_ACESA|nr:hypothetical protein LWI29_025690 [Acer saccharum]